MNAKKIIKMTIGLLLVSCFLLNAVIATAACIIGTNSNNLIIIEGVQQRLSTTIVNPYSGESIVIDQDTNLNARCYDGLGGMEDVLRGTNFSDTLFMEDSAGAQTVFNIEYFVWGRSDDIIILASSNFAMGNALIEGNAGDDILWANAGDDTLYGHTGNDTINGGPGNDFLQGGAETDTLRGWTGDDTYFYDAGDGGDIIREGGGGLDTLELGPGIISGDISTSVEGNDLVVDISAGAGRITIENQFGADGLDTVETLLFSDGTTIDLTALAGAFVLKQILATGQPGFGVPVALDGNTALVGAPHIIGSASLLDILNGGVLQTFDNPNPGTAGIGFDEYAQAFQTTVALSSGRAFISAARESFETIEGFGAIDSGAVYMFDTDTGALLHTFIHPNPIDELGGPGFGQGFGREIAVNGDYLLVGTNVREAFLFDVVTGDLLLTFSDPIPGFLGFGADVALSDQFIAIGDSTNSGSAGAVHLFDKTSGAFLRTFFNPTPNSADFFGEEIAVDGDRILIGAGQVDVDGISNAGEAYLFDATTGQLLHTFVDPTGNTNAVFGRHVDIEGDVVAIGVQGDSEVHIFDAISGGILQTITEQSAFAVFGRSVDLDQGNLLVGMPFGKAYFYGKDQNQAPTSNAGLDQLVFVGSTVVLDGTGSTDPESDPLSYSWIISSAPPGNTAVLIGTDTDSPSFEPDQEGLYEVELVVSDFFGPGAVDSVEIMVISSEQFAVIEIISASESIVVLEPGQITTQGNQNALMNFLIQAAIAIQEGDPDEAISKLQKALLRTDGCILRGAADGNGPGRDWITDCVEQASVYASLSSALEALSP